MVDTDILIIGAGPVGLFLANECARRGLRWRLVETRAGQSEHSKALAIFPRTLEVFDMAGVSGPFLDAANRVTKVAVMTHQRSLAHMRFEPAESPYPFVGMVPQDVTERLLADALGRKGGTVEYEATFVSATQDAEHVTATVNRKGTSETVTASFVVGCDGAHSAVRHGLNLPFEGAAYDQLFMLADVETNDAFPGDEMQLCPSEFGPVAIFPMSATRRRVVGAVDAADGEAPTLDVVRAIVAQRAPAGLDIRSVHWSSYFRVHHRQVASMRDRRIFVAGDAAHIHSPFGGQGMNTGLQDAWNLAWKLDLFVRGHGNQQLLDSYNAERLPVIKSVIETTHLMTMAMSTPSKLAQALRDTMIPMVSRLAPFQHAFVDRLSELGIAYRGSPIVEGPGRRYFDDTLRGGAGIRSKFLLFAGDQDGGAKQLCASFPATVEFRSSPNPGVVLVRPDGYIASESLATMRPLLERQTT
jgi:2-polyprenyl-6-methoxyphenol hydroxylase-like FAD-dependent oxidoreductase